MMPPIVERAGNLVRTTDVLPSWSVCLGRFLSPRGILQYSAANDPAELSREKYGLVGLLQLA
jgi:hypothetical protein